MIQTTPSGNGGKSPRGEPMNFELEPVAETLSSYGYQPKGVGIWAMAFTHKSYANEHGLSYDNERLEFLGDAVVELGVSLHLYHAFPQLAEGDLARLRAAVVRTEALAEAARTLGLGDHLRLGVGELRAGGRSRDSLLANLYEAVVGAICLEAGWEDARRFVLTSLETQLNALVEPKAVVDSKSALQEYLQARGEKTPTYRLVKQLGPAHNRRFIVEVMHTGQVLGRGEGNSKKAAEQQAAQKALAVIRRQKGKRKKKA